MASHNVEIAIDLAQGTFHHTYLDNGQLKLQTIQTKDENDNVIYQNYGWWESSVIELKDTVHSFQSLVKHIDTKAKYKILTKTSLDRSTWSNYEEINNANGSIKSPLAKYIMIKIEVTPDLVPRHFIVDDFQKDKFKVSYVNSANGEFRLKRLYKYRFKRDNAWKYEGTLLRKKIEKSKFKKIDQLILQS
ncbi:hypothetical protein PAALTS15_20788 [Paenibacillus alvei TS-15]|uniref:Uncharacterized protein n=1 Tax=Paenibacillus alvei TS-15 TaxID=1117108 RepID=S9TSR9_PAEAL|nr:hypothetical protein [Paenibacillus alvei]EPY05366.1 hypothetical protein PAALTS15_20788 [Paenibacillus alvei TS-15]